MRSTNVIVAGVLLVVGLAVGAVLFDRLRPHTRPVAIDEDSIVMLGDSITEQGDWGGRFEGLPIVNAGHPGFTTAELVPVAVDVAAAHPRLLLIMTGTNDIRDRRDPSWTRRHLGEIIDVVRRTSPTTRIVVQTILPRGDRPDEVLATNEAIRSLANEPGVELLDLYPTFDAGTGGLRQEETTDGIHLSDAGYDRWAGALRPILPTG